MSSNPISAEATASPNPINPVKKRRNLPGNPDPDAEVIALSPKSLMATNRFMCEICNKGFQRDQNLQLHRRGHNLPWKLKQRASKELIRKKVYTCPEVTCVHHHPSRALGDLTGIKKHFSRKHGEKKYKCDKCPKKYAVQSDLKAHSKTCGTREYRCDCGTIFSRRDSFITHRAFCDALAEESAKSIVGATNPIPISNNNITSINSPQYPLLFSPEINQQPSILMRASECNNSTTVDVHNDDEVALKREQQQHFNMRPADQTQPMWADQFSCHDETQPMWPDQFSCHDETQPMWPDQFSCRDQTFPLHHHLPLPASTYHQTSPHLSDIALLQKAAEMGATMSRPAHTNSASCTTTTTSSTHSPLLQEMMMMSSSSPQAQGLNEGMTRDFLGLKALSHKEIFSMAAAGLDLDLDSHYPCMRPSFENSQQNKRSYMN